MKNPELFDHLPDPELGQALRAALERSDDSAFVARVMARCSKLWTVSTASSPPKIWS